MDFLLDVTAPRTIYFHALTLQRKCASAEGGDMPLLWSVNHGARVVRLRLVEPLAFDEWFATVERIAHDSSIDRRYRILVDRTRMRALTEEFAQQMALYFSRRRSLFAERRIAVLTSPAVVSSMAPIQAVLNGRVGAQLRVFTKLDDAHRWLVEYDDKLASIPW